MQRKSLKRQPVFCQACGKIQTCDLVTGKEIYPHRKDLYQKHFYRCPVCKNYVGVHIGTDIPLGTIPTLQVRKLRMMIHQNLDPIWRQHLMTRSELYAEISRRLGYNYHTSNLDSSEDVQKILQIIKNIKQELETEEKF